MTTTTFEVLTLFPAAIEAFVGAGLLGKAIAAGRVAVHATDIRAFSTDRNRTVDDAPFGGGAGMVIKPEPVVAALESVIALRGPVHRVLLTPSAPRFDQRVAERLAAMPRIALLCGRYEGIDDRVREHYVDECLSLGDFVLGGGEVAALAIIEAVTRLCEGVVGNPDSIVGDSFATDDTTDAILEHPQYTRPAVFRGHAVPEVLLGGNHGAIARWRRDAALARTWALRPELRRASLPADATVHLAIDGAIDPDELAPAIGDLARTHGLADLVVLGGSSREDGAELATRWSRALGGRPGVTVFGELKSLRRRMRQRGRDPWVIALTDAPGAARSAGEALDRWRACAPVQGRDLVLFVPASAVSAGPAPGELPQADAAWWPDAIDGRLAPRPVIADAPPPAARVAFVARALTELAARRPAPDDSAAPSPQR